MDPVIAELLKAGGSTALKETISAGLKRLLRQCKKLVGAKEERQIQKVTERMSRPHWKRSCPVNDARLHRLGALQCDPTNFSRGTVACLRSPSRHVSLMAFLSKGLRNSRSFSKPRWASSKA